VNKDWGCLVTSNHFKPVTEANCTPGKLVYFRIQENKKTPKKYYKIGQVIGHPYKINKNVVVQIQNMSDLTDDKIYVKLLSDLWT
jgi:hypothetical protein